MKMKLSWIPARFTDYGFKTILDGLPNKDPQSVEVKNAAEAEAALQEYKKNITVDAVVFASVPRGERKFRGYEAWNVERKEEFKVRRGVVSPEAPEE